MTEKKTSIKSKIGIGLVIFGFITPVFGLLVPFLNLNTSITTALIAILMVGGPEIFMLLGAALAGKEGVLLVKAKIRKILGLPEGKFAATRGQYNLALFLMGTWLFLSIIPGYIPEIMEVPFITDNLFWVSLTSDVILLISIFFLGGHQMVTKIAKLFTWEKWELPE